MTCTPAQCASCSKPCASKEGNGDISEADLQGQLQAALERARIAEEAFQNLKNQAAQNGSTMQHELKPLRS
jgi:hypothetical protein